MRCPAALLEEVDLTVLHDVDTRMQDRPPLDLAMPAAPVRAIQQVRAGAGTGGQNLIEVLGAGVSSDWDAYVAARPDSTCYHLSGWSEIAVRAYDLASHNLVARGDDGAIRGVLPLFLVPRPFCHYLTSGLFGAYGPLLAEDDRVAGELLGAARKLCDDLRADHLHVKLLGESAPPSPFHRQDNSVTALLSLAGGAQAVWKNFKSSIRAAVRQAERSQLELRWGNGELPAFYDVLADNMRRKGSPIYGLAFMQAMLDVFAGRAEVVTLYHQGEVVSGAFCLRHGDVLYVPFASSRHSAFSLRPNNLLYWRIIERATAAGATVLDFGSSPRGSSTLAFKHHFGAQMVPITSLIYTRSAQLPTMVPDTAALRAGIRILQALPRPLGDAVGPLLSRIMA